MEGAVDITAREVVRTEFEVVWTRATPGNRPQRSIAMYWFREGRNRGLAAHAAQDKSKIKELHARIQKLEQGEAGALLRRERQLTEALAELVLCARKLRHSAQCKTERKRDLARIEAALHVAGALTKDYSTKVTA
jgi:hypothetical protein